VRDDDLEPLLKEIIVKHTLLINTRLIIKVAP